MKLLSITYVTKCKLLAINAGFDPVPPCSTLFHGIGNKVGSGVVPVGVYPKGYPTDRTTPTTAPGQA